jgi:hypothetical protein
MSASAVPPMPMPIKPRRSAALPIAWVKNASGYSSSVVTTDAEIMKVPSAKASMRNSGQ